MKILSIASIMPVPQFVKENRYVIDLNNELIKTDPTIEFSILRPSPLNLFKTNSNWKIRNKVSRLKHYKFEEYSVQIYRYFGIASSPLLFLLTSVLSVLFNIQLLKQFKHYNLTHAHYLFPDGVISLYLKIFYNIPYILTLQDERRLLKNFIVRKFTTYLIKRSSSTVSVSSLMVDEIKKSLNIDIIHLGIGVDNSFYNYSNPNKKFDGKILSIGSFISRKNHLETIKSLKILEEMSIDFNLTLVGEGSEKEEIENLIESLNFNNKIQIINNVPYCEIHNTFKKHDLFILCSKQESWGRVYIEAMAMGLPVILSSNIGIRKYIRNFDNALVINHEDPQDIAGKLKILFEDEALRYHLSLNGRLLANSLSWSNIAINYKNLYTNSQK